MSSEIFYTKAFIKVGDNFIPLVNHGSSNCTTINVRGREVAEKHWSVRFFGCRWRCSGSPPR